MGLAATKLSQPIETADTHSSRKALIGGVITGQIAGLIMAVAVMAVFTIFYGKSPLYPVQVIGSAVFGADALNGFHFGALLAGLLLHQLGPSLLWGVIFGVFAKNTSTTKQALMIGLLIGVVSMVDVYVIVPFAMKSLHGVDFWNQEVPMFWDWVAHIIFGASFALYPKVRARLG